MGKNEYDIEEVENKLNANMRKLKFIHPNMEMEEDFRFEPHEEFLKFIKTYIKITRIGNKEAKGYKRYEDILSEVNDCVYIILIHYYQNAKDEIEKQKYEKHLRYVVKVIYSGTDSLFPSFDIEEKKY